jgi:hypothetical protein
MRSFFLAVAMICGGVALADQFVVTTTTTITTAQEDAETMARTGILRHCGRAGGRREGIGMGPTPQAAERNCCYYGRYRIVEKGVAWSPVKRAYFAVIRYE